jgi:hypothetical protein
LRIFEFGQISRSSFRNFLFQLVAVETGLGPSPLRETRQAASLLEMQGLERRTASAFTTKSKPPFAKGWQRNTRHAAIIPPRNAP